MDWVQNGLERALLGRARADRRRAERETRAVAAYPDRRLLTEAYLPAIAARGGAILWIGTRPYTALAYAILESGGGQVWTSDIDPDAARWGRPGRHRTGDVLRIDRLFADTRFETVIYNGVVGFGVDAPEDQQASLDAIATVLRPGGLLLFGWNTDRIADPALSGVIGPAYMPTDFAGQSSRVRFPNSTHVYDALIRT